MCRPMFNYTPLFLVCVCSSCCTVPSTRRHPYLVLIIVFAARNRKRGGRRNHYLFATSTVGSVFRVVFATMVSFLTLRHHLPQADVHCVQTHYSRIGGVPYITPSDRYFSGLRNGTRCAVYSLFLWARESITCSVTDRSTPMTDRRFPIDDIDRLDQIYP